MSKTPEQRRIENEVTFHKLNEIYKEAVADYLTSDENGLRLLDFFCECQTESCVDMIKLTVDEYDRLHRNDLQFIVKPGHEQSTNFDILAENSKYCLVQKHPT